MSIFGKSSPSGSSIKFPKIGAEFIGTIAGEATERPMTEFGTKKPLFWDNDGSPRMQAVIPFVDEAGIAWRLYAPTSGRLFKAVDSAITAAGLIDLPIGTKMSIKYTEDIPGKGAVPAKGYAAKVLSKASASAPVAAAADEDEFEEVAVEQAVTKKASAQVDPWGSDDNDDF